MKFTVVIDNYCAKSGMLAERGYCSLLETDNGNVMIDTGGTGHVLRHNLDFLKIDLKKLSALVLSHSHHDHISGLLDIVFSCPGIPIYEGKGIEIERRGDADASKFFLMYLPSASPNRIGVLSTFAVETCGKWALTGKLLQTALKTMSP